MKLKTINYFYDFAHVRIYLRYYVGRPDKAIFNDRIYINKRCKPLQVSNYYDFISLSLKIYKNTTLDFLLSPEKFEGFYHAVTLSIV